MAHKRHDEVDQKRILDAAGRVRDVLCSEASRMVITGRIYQARGEAMAAIDSLA
jgi:hypothetical protein